MHYLKEDITRQLTDAALALQKEHGSAGITPELERTVKTEFGDYSSNFAMKIAKEVKQNPRAIAEAIAGALRPQGELFTDVKVAGPGFINFYLNPQRLLQEVSHIRCLGRRYGCAEWGRGRKALLEFVSANPVGPLNIVSARAAAVGDALARILASQGLTVSCEYYVNDAGRQALLLGKSLYVRWRQAEGETLEFPEEGYHGEYVKHLALELAAEYAGELRSASPEQATTLFWKHGVAKMVESHRQDLAHLGVRFDSWFSELQLHLGGQVEKAAKALEERGCMYRQDGALWFKSTAWGDDKDRVVQKANGDWAYIAADIAYHLDKFQRGYTELIDLWGPDHHGYIARMRAAIQALGYSADAFTVHIVQQVNLMEAGKPIAMSKRAGRFVTMRELVDDVGPDVARFFFLMRSTDAHLDFDLDLARRHTEDNPVFYVQYAHARICSILKKAALDGFELPDLQTSVFQGYEPQPEEKQLARELAAYPETVEVCARTLEPHGLTFALRDLATSFHRFYTVCRVLDDQAQNRSRARLAMVDATRIVLQNGLDLLGINAPESM